MFRIIFDCDFIVKLLNNDAIFFEYRINVNVF